MSIGMESSMFRYSVSELIFNHTSVRFNSVKVYGTDYGDDLFQEFACVCFLCNSGNER